MRTSEVGSAWLAPVIVLGHFSIEGMKTKDMEFELHHATEVVVPQAAFTGVALAAVGHIHSPQDCHDGGLIRGWTYSAYCRDTDTPPCLLGVGSLIRHSFAEAADAKSYALVTIDGGQVTWERRAVPCREMVVETLSWGGSPLKLIVSAMLGEIPSKWPLVAGKEVKLVIEVREDQLSTFDPSVFDPIKDVAAYFVMEKRTISVERRRAPAMAQAATLDAQLTGWLDATDQTLEPARVARLSHKVMEVQQ